MYVVCLCYLQYLLIWNNKYNWSLIQEVVLPDLTPTSCGRSWRWPCCLCWRCSCRARGRGSSGRGSTRPLRCPPPGSHTAAGQIFLSEFVNFDIDIRAENEGYPKVPENITITEKALIVAFSWLKVPTSAFTFKTLLRRAFSVSVDFSGTFG